MNESERSVKILTGRPGRPKGVTIIGGKPEVGVKILSQHTVEKRDDKTDSPGTDDAKES